MHWDRIVVANTGRGCGVGMDLNHMSNVFGNVHVKKYDLHYKLHNIILGIQLANRTQVYNKALGRI